MLGGLIAGGVMALGSLYAAHQQANANSDAASTSAGAMVEAARLGSEAQIRSSQIEAAAQRRASAMQEAAMRQSMQQQREISDAQMRQAEKLATRQELRFVVGQAVTDTFEKVSGAFTSWAQATDIEEEQAMRAQFGLQNDPQFEPPVAEPSMWEMMNTDLLTGEQITDDNPYQLSRDGEREMDAEVQELYPDNNGWETREPIDFLPEGDRAEYNQRTGDAQNLGDDVSDGNFSNRGSGNNGSGS